MSYQEYKNMYIKCQETAPYRMFFYDVVDSKNKLTLDNRNEMVQLLFNVYKQLEEKEISENKKILHKSDFLISTELEKINMKKDTFYKLKYQKYDKNKIEVERADITEPFAFSGDMMGFTTLRGTITAYEIDEIFENEKKKLGLELDFHKANGYYETDKWEEGGKLYFRGYCMCQLDEISKQKSKEEHEEYEK